MTNPPPAPGPPGNWGDQSGPSPQGSWGQQPPTQPGQYPGHEQQPAMPYRNQPSYVNPYESESTPILVTGILSLVLCGLIGIYAWMKGNDLRSRAESSGWPEPSSAKVGRILGIVGTVIGLIQIGFAVLWFLLVLGIMGSGAATY